MIGSHDTSLEQIQELHVAVALESFRLPLDDPNFRGTARRWAGLLRGFLQAYDPTTDLITQFPPKVAGTQEASRYGYAMVVQGGIPYQALCAHHLVPVLGRASVGYIPVERVVGLSKLTRLVWGLSHRTPSLQEDITNQVVDALTQHLKPQGAMCVIQAEHGCMACRGVAQQGIVTSTSAIRGVFISEAHAREEFYRLANIG
jgi:GTP cyclohydrolase I